MRYNPQPGCPTAPGPVCSLHSTPNFNLVLEQHVARMWMLCSYRRSCGTRRTGTDYPGGQYLNGGSVESPAGRRCAQLRTHFVQTGAKERDGSKSRSCGRTPLCASSRPCDFASKPAVLQVNAASAMDCHSTNATQAGRTQKSVLRRFAVGCHSLATRYRPEPASGNPRNPSTSRSETAPSSENARPCNAAGTCGRSYRT